MKNLFKKIMVVGSLFVGFQAGAHSHPGIGGPMIHLNITRPSVDTLNVMAMGDGDAIAKLNVSHDWANDSPFAVFNGGFGYTGRYGWLPGPGIGFDDKIKITLLDSTEGLETFEGGETPHLGSFDGIFGTDGSDVSWDLPELAMWHNWYAADTAGLYEATYRVDLLNDAGDLLVSSEPITIQFDGRLIPEPGSLVLLGLGGLALISRQVG